MGTGEVIRGLLVLLFYQTSWSYIGRQGLGLKFALLWTANHAAQRARIMAHCRGALNTNPFVAGMVVGSILRAEDEALELEKIDRSAQVAQSTLAAGGDRFFWQTLRPALGGLSVIATMIWLLAVPDNPGWFPILAILLLPLGFTLTAQGVRLWGLRNGYRKGMAAISILQRGFDRLTRVIGFAGAGLAGMLITGAGIGLLGDRSGYWFLPLAGLAYVGLLLRISQTYLYLALLLIFLAGKLLL